MTGLDLGVMEVKDSLKPKITYLEKADYTKQARDQGIEGVVVVSAIFRADGKITDIKVLQGLNSGLNDQALSAASKIKFTPATKDGRPVSVRMTMEFTFHLKE